MRGGDNLETLSGWRRLMAKLVVEDQDGRVGNELRSCETVEMQLVRVESEMPMRS